MLILSMLERTASLPVQFTVSVITLGIAKTLRETVLGLTDILASSPECHRPALQPPLPH